MAKYTGPKCKLCRREGTKLFLKGTRCITEKCAIVRRNQIPGQHGVSRRRRRVSDYGRHLREKQKVKRIYGLLEAQFRRYYARATKVKGITGQILLQILERRLDNVIYITGIGVSRSRARQLVRQGKVTVNGKNVNIPSYQVKVADIIGTEGVEIVPKSEDSMPSWILWKPEDNAFKISRLPQREDSSNEIQEQLIVEYYSR